MLLPCIYTHHLFKTKLNCYFGATQHRNDLQVQLTTWSTMELTQVCMVYLTIYCSINAKLGSWKSPRLESTFSVPFSRRARQLLPVNTSQCCLETLDNHVTSSLCHETSQLDLAYWLACKVLVGMVYYNSI